MSWSTNELIGVATEPLESWDDGSERRGLEHELFRAQGIPTELMPWARALRWTFPPDRPLPDSPVDLRVGGDAPPRTLSELIEAVVQHRMGLALTLPDGFDLSRLAPLIADVSYLSIGSAGSVAGFGVLDEAVRLVQLISWCDASGAPSSELPELRRVLGSRELLGLACAAPNLVELQIDLASKPWPPGLGIDGPIEYLELERAAKLETLPRLEHPQQLRTLRIYDARELDLGTLPPDVDLEWLDVYRTKVLRGAGTIARMTRLRTLNLERVTSIPGAGILSQVTARAVNVSRSDPAAQLALKRES